METKRFMLITGLLSVFLLIGMVSGAVSSIQSIQSTQFGGDLSLNKSLYEPCSSNYDCGWGYCGSELGAVFDSFPSYCTNFCTPDGMEKGGVESCGNGVCKLLDPTVGYCVECLEESDCKGEGYECNNNNCVYRGLGTEEDPYLVYDCVELQNIADYSGTYYDNVYIALANDIDCSDTINWNDGKGFEPINLYYYSHFDGSDYVIRNLYINRPDQEYNVGLFGENRAFTVIANIEDSFVVGKYFVGCFMGYNYITSGDEYYYSANVNNCTVIGEDRVGGIGGLLNNLRNSTIKNSVVLGNNYVGGIVGGGYASYSSAENMVVKGNNYIGGILGAGGWGNYLEQVYFEGDVEGSWYVGGLVGDSYTTINNSYAVGTATGIQRVGGLAGYIRDVSTIENSYANVDINGSSSVGTLVGYSSSGWVRDSFSLGNYLFIGPYSIPSVIGNGARNTFSSLYYYNGSDDSPKWCFNYDGTYGDCVGIEDLTYFYNSSNAPMSSWDFENVWAEVQRDFPILKWQVDQKECINDSMCSEGQECHNFYCISSSTEEAFSNDNNLNEDNPLKKDDLESMNDRDKNDGNDEENISQEFERKTQGTSLKEKTPIKLNSFEPDDSLIVLKGEKISFISRIVQSLNNLF